MGGRSLIGAMLAGAALVTAQAAGAVTFNEYPIGAYPAHAPRYIKAGPDGNLWFADGGTEGGIGRISPQGELFTEFGPPGISELAFNSQGAVFWAGDKGFGERDRLGTVSGSGDRTLDYAAATSPSGEFWFSTIGAEWCHPPLLPAQGEPAPSQPCESFGMPSTGRITSIAFDHAGNPWGAFYEENSVRELVPPFTRVDLPTSSGPARIALGPEGDLWVTMFDASSVDRITPAGARTRFPLSPGAAPNDIVLGPDGALWFVEYKANKIGRMTTAGIVTGEFALPTPNAQPIGITVGSDGAIWFTESLTAKIGRLAIDPATTAVQPGAGGGGGPTGSRDTTAPSFTHAPSLHPARFRDRGRSGGRVPKGSSLALAVSEASSLKAGVAASRTGRRVHGSCLGVSSSNRGKPHCRRYVTVGSLNYKAVSGANRFAFSGRVGGRTLSPGEYRLSLVATDAAGNGSAPAMTAFAIVP